MARFVVMDVFPPPKTSAQSTAEISLSDIERCGNDKSQLAELVRVQCEIALASLEDLLREAGVDVSTIHSKMDGCDLKLPSESSQ